MLTLKRISLILLALVVFFGLVGATSQPTATVENCKQWHTVQRGDYLVSIAKLYDTNWLTLAEINGLKDPSRIYPGQKLCVSQSGTSNTVPVVLPVTSSSLRVFALSVKEDQYVVLQGVNLDANARYTVYFSRYGALSTSAILGGSAYTDKYGSFKVTYDLPKKLIDTDKISVNLYNASGDSASNWFYNTTATGSKTGGTQVPVVENCKKWHTVQRGEYLVAIARIYNTSWRTLSEINGLNDPSRIYPGQNLCVLQTGTSSTTPIVVPTTGSGVRVYALSVKEDQYVVLQGVKLVANSRYTVYFSKYGSLSTSAILTGYAYTDKDGSFKTTYTLPKKLVDIMKIGINLYNVSGDSASNWFINATLTGNTGGIQAPEFGFSIRDVDKNNWVKIKTSNLPANVTFDVFMGKAGTKGVKGIHVGTVRDDEGGSINFTFDIPSELQDRSKIDLRIENEKLGWFAYVTFENED
jgi:LysM repeat protein